MNLGSVQVFGKLLVSSATSDGMKNQKVVIFTSIIETLIGVVILVCGMLIKKELMA